MTNHRVHQVLDGELPAEALSAKERALLLEHQRVTARLSGELRGYPTPDVVPAVMAGVRAQPDRPPFGERVAKWLWTPRPVFLRPAHVLGGGVAALLVAAAAYSGWLAPAGPAEEPPIYVQFRLDAAGASRVSLAGTFTDWQPEHALRQTSPGVWIAVVPLEPGVHDYAFLVDGDSWVADPGATRVDDGFGGVNSRISLLPPADDRNGA
ncbi:MAG: glycogen-binding domain-containing protein [Longimicrobiaceae bacterium]